MPCREPSDFDGASLAVLHSITTLTLLELFEQRTLVAAIAELQQHNPTLEVCMRIN